MTYLIRLCNKHVPWPYAPGCPSWHGSSSSLGLQSLCLSALPSSSSFPAGRWREHERQVHLYVNSLEITLLETALLLTLELTLGWLNPVPWPHQLCRRSRAGILVEKWDPFTKVGGKIVWGSQALTRVSKTVLVFIHSCFERLYPRN